MWPVGEIVFLVLIQASVGGILTFFLPPIFHLEAGGKRGYILVLFLLLGIAFPVLPGGRFAIGAAWIAATMLLLMLVLFMIARLVIRADVTDTVAGCGWLWPAGGLAALLLASIAAAYPGGHSANFSETRLAVDLLLSAMVVGASCLLFVRYPRAARPAILRAVSRLLLIAAAFRLLLTANNALALRPVAPNLTAESGGVAAVRLLSAISTLIIAAIIWYSNQSIASAPDDAGNANGSEFHRAAEALRPSPAWAAANLIVVLAGQFSAAVLLAGYRAIL